MDALTATPRSRQAVSMAFGEIAHAGFLVQGIGMNLVGIRIEICGRRKELRFLENPGGANERRKRDPPEILMSNPRQMIQRSDPIVGISKEDEK